jgi:hypothetical protein
MAMINHVGLYNKECIICNNKMQYIFTNEVLNKYAVKYFYCNICGFVQTEYPFWLEEAYHVNVNLLDTGIISRNIDISHIITCILYELFDCQGKYLDVGGGYGILTRLMRDVGFDFYSYDIYCENIFAKGFDIWTTTPPFNAVTCFEVLEHTKDPVSFLRDSLSKAMARTAIFSTELFTDPPPKPQDWWYYSLGSGQHVSFFQLRTLKFIANQLHLKLYSNSTIHIITDKALPHNILKVLMSRFSGVLSHFIKRKMKSRTFSDHQMLSKSLSSGTKDPEERM